MAHARENNNEGQCNQHCPHRKSIMIVNQSGTSSPRHSSTANSINVLIDAVTTVLHSVDADIEGDTIETAEQQLRWLISSVQEQSETINQQSETITQQSEEIDELKSELAEHRAESAKDRAETRSEVTELGDQMADQVKFAANTRKDLKQLEETVETSEDEGKGNSHGHDSDETEAEAETEDDQSTALEQVCALPEHIAVENLTSNQKRARSVARRIKDYGKSVPAGIAITSTRIRDVLTAQEDKRIHRQTVQRVADFLKEFGDGGVEIKETRGGKTAVVFDDGLADDVTSVVTASDRTTVTPGVV